MSKILLCLKGAAFMRSIDVGYVNKRLQRNMGITDKRAVRPYANIYRMRCEKCGYEYFANGSDIHLKKCPQCQGEKKRR